MRMNIVIYPMGARPSPENGQKILWCPGDPTKKKGPRQIWRSPSYNKFRKEGAYAAFFTLSTATATRFESGWNASPASFKKVSVFFDVCETNESKPLRAISPCN